MLRALATLVLLSAAWAHPAQAPFGHASSEEYAGPHTPRIHYNMIPEHAGFADPPRSMSIQPIHTSGPSARRVDLTFFSDGYTSKEEKKFIHDARVLADELVSDNGAMAHVKDLLNIWAVFSPSKHSGVGVHDTPLEGNPFGLYRPGPELRGVYVKHPKVARAACRYWRDSKHGGCDSAILLGNDPLYGGLGGEFTVITSSDKNGPLILRHELGHTLIPVGDEYDGEAGYCGVNAERVGKLQDIKWKKYLTNPDQLRVEDAQVRLQAYPWHDLSESAYEVRFFGSNPVSPESPRLYPTAHLRVSLSSIPYPSHINLTLNGERVDLSPAFEESWTGSKDRRWVDLDMPSGIAGGSVHLRAELTHEGRSEPAGQGGKMITSVEIMEYGTPDRFNGTAGYIGAFPVFGKDGKVTLRPTNEDCLMRKTTQPGFCPVCKDELRASLKRMIAAKGSGKSVAEGWDCKL